MPPAARRTDPVTALDTHVVATTAAASPVSLPFSGSLTTEVSEDVLVVGLGAATVGSVAENRPPHVPPPGTTFTRPPSNRGTVDGGSTSVLVNGKRAARAGDPVRTCNDPVDLPVGVVGGGAPTVLIGPVGP